MPHLCPLLDALLLGPLLQLLQRLLAPRLLALVKARQVLPAGQDQAWVGMPGSQSVGGGAVAAAGSGGGMRGGGIARCGGPVGAAQPVAAC
jgi:hypothetical protein